jgi:hypothetical protein
LFITISVGLCTLYLNTHWFSDVLGGWLAGGLVLISLPWLMPWPERVTESAIDRIRLARQRRRAARVPTRIPDVVPDDVLPDFHDEIERGGGSPGRSTIPVLSGRNEQRRTIDAR